MKHILVFTLLCVSVVVSGCSTYAVNRYSPNVDDVVALRSLNKEYINVGNFKAGESAKQEIMCRAVGPIKTPDGETYAQFVRKAFVDELKLAGVFSATAPVTLTGTLDSVDFSSMSGTWNLALTISSTNGKSMTVTENYEYESSYYGETACQQTAQALMPAVQNLVGKVFQSRQFLKLLD